MKCAQTVLTLWMLTLVSFAIPAHAGGHYLCDKNGVCTGFPDRAEVRKNGGACCIANGGPQGCCQCQLGQGEGLFPRLNIRCEDGFELQAIDF